MPEALARHKIPGATPAAAAWFAHLADTVLLVDADRCILYANHPIAGLQPAELLGVDAHNVVPASHRDAFDVAVADAFHPGVPHTLELPLLRNASGENRWCQAAIAPLALPSVRAALIVAADVSAHHDEAEQLRRVTALLQDTEGITRLGTWTWDISKPNAQWSPGLYTIYGLDPRTHTPTYQDYLSRVHPDDRERVRRATEGVFRDLQPYSHDERIQHADGTWRDLHTWTQPVLDAEGHLVALMGICQDITDRKNAERNSMASEARFRAIFDRSAVGMAILDHAGTVLDANAALLALANLPTGGLDGRSLASLVRSDDTARYAAILKAATASTMAQQARLTLTPADAPPRAARVQLAQVPPDAGQQGFLVAVVEDASLEERAAEADRVAFARLLELRQAEDTNARRTRLLHMASHELKNPITPVVLQLHMLGRGVLGPLNEPQARAVDVASKQVQRMAKLLRDVLDMTRIEQSQLTMRPVPMDAGALALQVVDDYREVAAQWSVSLHADASPGAWVVADPERIEQVLVNLIGNALKFTQAGGHVGVTTRREGGALVLEVADDGPGMDGAQVQRLFRPFSQVHATGLAREEGTGLGLFICKSIVEASGGTVEVDSEPGHGSKFRVRLPARDAPPSAKTATHP